MAVKCFVFLCFIVVAVKASSSFLQPSSHIEKVKCEHEQIDIRCGNNKINILYASYGSPPFGQCGSNPGHYYNRGKGSTCRAANSLKVVRGKCQGKNDCWVKAHNDVFGDPCVGVRKALVIHYTCVDYEIVGKCEGKQIDIRCGQGKTINILYAIYGSNFGDLCTNSFNPWKQVCAAKKSFSVTRNQCQGKQNCWVKAKDNVFDKNCRQPSALQIEYRCVRGKIAFACENKQVDISCPSRTTINIISAFYGRNNQQGCRNPVERTSFGLRIRSPCSAANALSVAKKYCNGKHNCWIKARDSVFNNSCRGGSSTHLEVEYECRKH